MVAMRRLKQSSDRHRNGVAQHERGRRRDERREGSDMLTGVRQDVSGALHSVMQGAQSVAQQIVHTTGEVTGAVVDTVLDEAERIYRRQKKPAISRISSLSKMADRTAHALHAVKADGVADYVEQAAEQVDGISEYLEDRTLGEILEDAGEAVQRNRAVAMGGMFVAGFAVARFLKASASRGEDDAGGGGGDRAEQDHQHEDDAERTPRHKKQKRRPR